MTVSQGNIPPTKKITSNTSPSKSKELSINIKVQSSNNKRNIIEINSQRTKTLETQNDEV